METAENVSSKRPADDNGFTGSELRGELKISKEKYSFLACLGTTGAGSHT